MQDKLLIVTKIKKTIDYINNVLVNFPKVEYILRNNISDNFYKLLELVYQANIHKDIFLIRESKIRIIMSQNIIDKVINHVVSQYFLVDEFEKYLIEENVATRINKGTKYGIVLLKKYLNEVKTKKFYVLKFDIEKYFFNIDYEIVKNC